MKIMKTKKVMIALIGAMTLMASCNKMDIKPENLFKKNAKVFQEKENHCPVVRDNEVPSEVTTAFYGTPTIDNNGNVVSYSNHNPQKVLAWFNKDNNGYCVYFIDANGVETKILYDNAGTVLKTEIESDKEDHDDKFQLFKKGRTKKDTGCECELEGHDNENEADDDHESDDDGE